MELLFSITSIIHETPDTKTFYLKPVNDVGISYKAGQFLTFIFDEAGHEVRRSYSLGSTTGVDASIFITVKRKENGSISRRLIDHYKTGDILKAIEPSGRFTIDEPLVKRYIFIAAGSGITPIFSLIKQLLYFHPGTTVLLINQCRNERNIIYAGELEELQTKFEARFTIIQLFSQPSSHLYLSKRVNNTWLEIMIRQQLAQYDIHNLQCYICGPVIFMLMAEFTLKLLHITDGQIHKEQFIISKPPPPPLVQDAAPKQVTLHYKKNTYTIQAAYPTSILDAALKKGIPLPYSCKAGICSTCAAQCVRGKIIMSNNEVLTGKDIEKGMILTCTGYAVTDIEISFDENFTSI